MDNILGRGSSMKTMDKEKWPVLFLEDTRADIKSLSRKEIFNYGGGTTRRGILGTLDEFYCFHTEYRPVCMGPKIFWKSCGTNSITFKGGRIYGELTPLIMNMLIEVFHLDWIQGWTRDCLRADKRLWAMVLKKKITNPEMLAKKFSKMYFKGEFSYKSIKKYFNEVRWNGISLYDIYYHTTNPDLFIQEYFEDSVKDKLIVDMFVYCRYENTKINPHWSEARLQQEHQQQIRRDHLVELEKMDKKAIAPSYRKDDLELILNEYACGLEGYEMDNCIHRCYWPSVEKGKYLIARGSYNDEYFDLGVWVRSDSISFDQVYKKHNKSVSYETERFCKKWIEDNASDLLEIAKSIAKKAKVSDGVDPFQW